MSDVNINFPPAAAPTRAVSLGEVEDMVIQAKADVEGQVSAVVGQVEGVTAQLDDNTKRQKNAQVDLVIDFGASTTKADNHNEIIAALDYLNTNGGGTLLVPIGVFKTSPLVLKNYRNIIIKGVSPSLPWKTTSCFKFISAGDVGLQFSEIAGAGYANEVPTWNSIEMIVENMRLDGNNMVKTCVNGNYGVTLRGVTCDYALEDGITLEPQAYPLVIERSYVRYCGRHGIYVKAPYSTVYNFYKVECQHNGGYGICITDGNTATLQDCLLQYNAQGGIKIEYKNPSGFTKPTFLGNLLFINLYTENNGTLATNDPKYEGNYAAYITGYDKVEGVNVNKIQNLTFINCAINYPAATGQKWKIEGVANITPINTTIPDEQIDYTKSGTFGVQTNLSTVQGLVNTSYPIPKSLPYYSKVNNIKTHVGDGFVGKRGRMRELHFQLPLGGITAGNTVTLNTVYNNGFKFYPILQTGSLYAINAMQRVKPLAGTLTFKIRRGYKSSATGGFDSTIATTEIIRLDNTKNFMSVNFPLLSYLVDASLIIGIDVEASADYVPGHASYDDIVCELFIES